MGKYIKAQLDEVVVPPDSRGNPKFKDSVDDIDRELAKLESENGGISNDSARARVASAAPRLSPIGRWGAAGAVQLLYYVT